eukprot:gene14259-14409_t
MPQAFSSFAPMTDMGAPSAQLAQHPSSLKPAAQPDMGCSSLMDRSGDVLGCFDISGSSSAASDVPTSASEMDIDALLAAASCKPGYLAQQRQQRAQVACVAAVSGVLEEYSAIPIVSGCGSGIADAALGVIAEAGVCDTFYVYDLGEVARLHATWVATMPRVKPFYAVKCNPEPGLIAMLDALGAGFDCASVQELQKAAALNVPQDRVIFANPCKRPLDFRYAREHGVEYTTFDCVSELEKIAVGYPAFKCVLRIRCDDADAKINLGLKYGADLCDVPMLMETARDLGLQVVGVSFHVGSGCQNVGVYADAISAAREAFDVASSYGFCMELLDIGGGFTAPYDEATAGLFYRTAEVIAEPGRYFAETSATLFTTILGQRTSISPGGQAFRDYWLSDGTYGSFRIQVAVDGLEPNYSVLRSPLLPPPTPAEESVLLPCRLWGNSNRDGDLVHKAAMLPPLRDGDWLMFPFAGAYTICAASNYGGVCFTQPLKVFVYSSEAVRECGAFDVQAAAQQAAAGALPVGACLPATPKGCPAKGKERLLPCVELLEGLSFSQGCNSDGSTDDDGESSVVSCVGDRLLQASMTSDSDACVVANTVNNGTCFSVTCMSFSSLDSVLGPAEEARVDAGATAATAAGCLDGKNGDDHGRRPMRVTGSSFGGSSCGRMGSDAGGGCGSVASEVTAVGMGEGMAEGVGGLTEGDMEICSAPCDG